MTSIYSESVHEQSEGSDVIIETASFLGTMNCGTGCGFADISNRAADEKTRKDSIRKLATAVIFCVIFMTVEMVGGIKANSLAVMTDAAHLLTDVAGFAISLFSIWASSWEATPRQSYGFHRIEILGALVSIQLIWLLTGVLIWSAIDRLRHDTVSVNGALMFIIATIGLVVNIIMIFLLGHGHDHDHGDGHSHSHSKGHSHDHGHDHVEKVKHSHQHGHSHKVKHAHEHAHKHKDVQRGGVHEHGHHDKTGLSKPLLLDVERDEHSVHDVHDHDVHDHNVHDHDVHSSATDERQPEGNKVHKGFNINVQGAYIHVLGDLIQSIGVMIGGAIIWIYPKLHIIDLICTLFFSLVVLGTTIKMLRSALEVLMESTPREIDATELEEGLCSIPGVLTVHELHIWAITVGKVLLACHVRIQSDANAEMVLHRVKTYIESEHNISHITVQIERET
ncbi:metal tolerance protein A1 [Cryptomeria japonica]|uniref:metal tolerance protein A1 n=1 Tax=Cryptomeria japonica TaxID=3369 RepID=UPI0027DA7853|nr:metal tolerance protein A1 [Cryptomeria japonica]XP_057852882.2 metal tolerance protein A1 [Cryptomeria japonica]XP_057852883.2 metal tolerance protein A1 [Cryptomeria japonica]